jgi:hypothetical protein
MKRTAEARPTGWFSPWKEWLGSTIIYWPLLVGLIFITVLKILQSAGCIGLKYESP